MPFDFPILYFIQEYIVSPILNNVMIIASALGEYGVIWFVSAIPLLFFKKTRICGILMICAMTLAFLVGELCIKNIVCRPRPCHIDTAVKMLVHPPGSYSFPSGHTSSSFAATTVIMYFNKKFGILALVCAGIIAFSRMYLFVHFPSDVFAGVLLGVLSALLVIFIYRKISLNKTNSLSK
ncbi:phosphatase PAP2 family protein [Oscillospiraceae bacterium LCP25S3_E10]|nr:phosphatase PAP2 family protein [Ruminococcus sp.]MDD6447577.1 phosphatase PAP2 family protein [Ruminococcus sp.]MDY2855792.1 phosphatase PAP2 family protein [Oscillospiraceae bacterium]